MSFPKLEKSLKIEHKKGNLGMVKQTHASHHAVQTSNLGMTRRIFLRGIGASLALPWLEAFHMPAWGQGTPPPLRFFAMYTPNGYNMDTFWPSLAGSLNANRLSNTSLAPLTAWHEQILILKGLDNFAATPQGDGPGDHARGTSCFLTCSHPLKSVDQLRSGISLDQVIAQSIGPQTSLSSLELSCEGGVNTGNCDSGYSCAYSRNISWSDAQTPLPREVNPRLLFERLYGNLDPNLSPEAIADRVRRKRSVLDFVLEDAAQLRARVSASDIHRVDAYLTGIREVERRLSQMTEDQQCSPDLDRPLGVPTQRPEHAELMLDLAASAIACDQTRVLTFMLGHGGSNIAHTHLGISEGHHALSHHQSDLNKLSQISQIDQWQVGLFERVLAKLASIDEGGQSALQSTTVMLSSEVADGNAHQHHALPVVLAGRCAGLSAGQYVDLGSGSNAHPIAELYLQIAQDMGVNISRFGDDGERPLLLPS